MKNRLFLLLFLMCAAQRLSAYPIPPQTLRMLIEESSFVVVATIDNPPANSNQNMNQSDSLQRFFFLDDDGLAKLNILEVLKGNLAAQKPLEVKYPVGMICPAPPRYPDKRVVVAFLGRDPKSKTYYTVGLSYGAKVMADADEAAIFRDRIVEYLAILKTTDKRKRTLATTEWLVKCAENKCTRWDGIYEIDKAATYMIRYDQSNEEHRRTSLTSAQQNRLDSAFYKTDTLDTYDLALIDLKTHADKTRLKAHLLKSLRGTSYYNVTDLMKMVISMDNSKELISLYEQAEAIPYNFDDEVVRNKQLPIIEQFITIAQQL